MKTLFSLTIFTVFSLVGQMASAEINYRSTQAVIIKLEDKFDTKLGGMQITGTSVTFSTPATGMFDRHVASFCETPAPFDTKKVYQSIRTAFMTKKRLMIEMQSPSTEGPLCIIDAAVSLD